MELLEEKKEEIYQLHQRVLPRIGSMLEALLIERGTGRVISDITEKDTGLRYNERTDEIYYKNRKKISSW